MKNRISSILCFFVFFVVFNSSVSAYSDTNITQEQGIAIESLTSQGLMTGYIDDTFKPNTPATRAEVAKVLAIAKNYELENIINPGFTDIPQSHPYYSFIAALANNDVISIDKKFNPDKTVTRGQLAKMLVRTFDLSGTKALPFNDANKSIFKKEISSMYANGIIEGISKTEYGVNSPITRGQLALLIHRIQVLQNPSPINGVWTGTYYDTSKNKMQLKLTISQNIGVYEFKDPNGTSGVSYSKINYDDETGILKSVDKKWYIQPSGYTLGNIEAAITPNNYLSGFFIFGSKVTTMELQSARSYPQDATSYLKGTWEGTSVTSNDDIQSISYIFNDLESTYSFGPSPKSPNLKSGVFGIKSETSNSGLLKFNPTNWIEQPSGYEMTSKIAVISNKGYIFGYSEEQAKRNFLVKKNSDK